MRREEGDSDRRDTVLDRPHSPTSLPTQQRPDDPTTKKSKRAEPLPPGTMAGRYVLLARLGAGGADLVYAAFDPQLDRKVAIKVLRAIEGEHPNAESARARLLREAQAMARLKHPNVLPVYDVGAFEDAHGSRVFIAMELVESGTLRTWFKERKRSRREVLDVMTACGRGLAAAHAAGLVHRDFKPDNVLVGNDGRVFVTDFGLVRSVGSSENPPVDSPQPPPTAITAPLTGAHAVMGTPGYMAPEQYEAGAIDERTDQFSFCVTLCEGLCGHKIFSGAMALNNLGLDAEAEGRLDAAEKYYRDSITLLENALGRDHPRVAIALSNFGTTLQAEHKSAEALAAFQRALAINTQRFGADYVDSFDALLGEGKALTSLGRAREAREPLEHALKIATSGEPSAWSTADAKFALAAALWEVGRDRKRARQMATEARTGMAGVSDSVAHRTLAEIDEWLSRHP